MYKIWSDLPEAAKNCWIQAGLTISGFDELAKTIPDKVGIFFYFILFIMYLNISF